MSQSVSMKVISEWTQFSRSIFHSKSSEIKYCKDGSSAILHVICYAVSNGNEVRCQIL